jgi:hypothetical protein
MPGHPPDGCAPAPTPPRSPFDARREKRTAETTQMDGYLRFPGFFRRQSRTSSMSRCPQVFSDPTDAVMNYALPLGLISETADGWRLDQVAGRPPT